MKIKRKFLLLSFIICLVAALGISLKGQKIEDIKDPGKKCKNDERCWNSTTVECDEFGDGRECVCYVCQRTEE